MENGGGMGRGRQPGPPLLPLQGGAAKVDMDYGCAFAHPHSSIRNYCAMP